MLFIIAGVAIVAVVAISPMLRTEFLGYVGRLMIFILHILNILPDPRFESSQKQGIYSETDLYRWLGVAVPPGASERDISGRHRRQSSATSTATGFSFGSLGLSIPGKSPLRDVALSPVSAAVSRSEPLQINTAGSLPPTPLATPALAAPFATPLATPTSGTVVTSTTRTSTYATVSHRRLSSVTTLPTISALGEVDEGETHGDTVADRRSGRGRVSTHAATYSETMLQSAYTSISTTNTASTLPSSPLQEKTTAPKARSKSRLRSTEGRLPEAAVKLAESVAAVLPNALSPTLQHVIGLSVEAQQFTLLVRSGHMPDRVLCVDWRNKHDESNNGSGVNEGHAVLRIGGDTVALSEITHVIPGKRKSLMAVMPEVKEIPASEAFSVISRGRVWDIYTRNAEQRTEWVRGLKSLVKEASTA